MKKKVILLTALVLLMSFLLCSCRQLDELKEIQATINDDRNAIIYNGKKYVAFNTQYSFCSGGGKIINVTDDDVPVLCSEWFGKSGQISKNGELILMYGGIGDMYCLEEKKSYYENAKPSIYGLYNDYKGEYEVLPDNVVKAVNDTLAGEGSDYYRNDEYVYYSIEYFSVFDETFSLCAGMYEIEVQRVFDESDSEEHIIISKAGYSYEVSPENEKIISDYIDSLYPYDIDYGF